MIYSNLMILLTVKETIPLLKCLCLRCHQESPGDPRHSPQSLHHLNALYNSTPSADILGPRALEEVNFLLP